MGSTSLSPDPLSFDQLPPSSLTAPSNVAASTACYPSLRRSVSTTSTGSVFSTKTSSTGRDSLGSTTSYTDNSVFHSSFSSNSSSKSRPRQSFGGCEKPSRRGYVRPQGTNFAASARSRESVLNLGSIAHLQYYFARTGLLDGKGGRRARKSQDKDFLEFPTSDNELHSTNSTSEIDYSFTSLGSPLQSPALGGRMSSPHTDEEEEDGEEYYSSEDDENHHNMLPPTVSTYNNREKYIPRLPSLDELKEELKKSLSDASKLLEELKLDPNSVPTSLSCPDTEVLANNHHHSGEDRGWHEVQGVYLLDVMTLAIRAAKMYYTAHEQPERLASIKPERQIRADLLSVMEVLRKMATRNFASGIKEDEREAMEQWVNSIYVILQREDAMIEAERSHCASWTWLDENWSGSKAEREWAFMKSMDPDPQSLPTFKSVDDVRDDELPTDFLKEFMTGLRLIKLHNVVVRRSKRPFGAIDKWHTDFRKPYRCTENLLFWIKAAELRFELILDIDVTSIVHGADRKAWKNFEDAILIWCGTVRTEISSKFRS